MSKISNIVSLIHNMEWLIVAPFALLLLYVAHLRHRLRQQSNEFEEFRRHVVVLNPPRRKAASWNILLALACLLMALALFIQQLR